MGDLLVNYIVALWDVFWLVGCIESLSGCCYGVRGFDGIFVIATDTLWFLMHIIT